MVVPDARACRGHPGPSQIALHQGHSVLITGRDGQIRSPSEFGLYFFDTRLISSWQIYANGEPWDLLNGTNISHYAARIYLINRSIATEGGDIPARTLRAGAQPVHQWGDPRGHRGREPRHEAGAFQSGDRDSQRLRRPV
jgi:N-terminal domain of (some) glycogen debranching enzymes